MQGNLTHCPLYLSPVALRVYPPYCCWNKLSKNKLCSCRSLDSCSCGKAVQPALALTSFPFCSQLFTLLSRQIMLLTCPEHWALPRPEQFPFGALLFLLCLANSSSLTLNSPSSRNNNKLSFAELFDVPVLKLAARWKRCCFSLGWGTTEQAFDCAKA